MPPRAATIMASLVDLRVPRNTDRERAPGSRPTVDPGDVGVRAGVAKW